MRCFPGFVGLTLSVAACGGATASVPPSSDAGVRSDASVRSDAPTGTGTVGTVCSNDGVAVLGCEQGLSCPTPAHGRDTSCCANASTSCKADTDCCSGACLTASGTCSQAGSPGRICSKGSDCVTGVCGPFGVCAAFDAGLSCQANAECASDLCTNGVCTCLATGTPLPADASVENCCSQSAGLLGDGGQGCG